MLTKDNILNQIVLNKTKLERYGVVEIGLFGSYVRDEQTRDSDIDILIDFAPENEKFDNFIEVCFLLEKIFKGKKIEIVTKNGLSPYIGPKILKEVEYV